MQANEEFSQRIARAREIGEDAIAQECLDIADNATNDWMERSDDNGGTGWQLNGEHIQRSKLRIDTRLKLLAKWNPKRWGEKVYTENEHKGANGGPLVIERHVIDPRAEAKD